MAQRKFQPTPLSTFITLIMFTVLIGLGSWQLQRLHWKEALLEKLHTRMAEKPVPMPEELESPADWEFRRVTLAGFFDYDHEMLVKPRTMDGKAGYDMVVPFVRASGGVVMVNRGWISDDLLEQAQRPSRGAVLIEGILQKPEKAYFTPENSPAKKDWYWVDIPAMAEASGLENVAPLLLNISEKKPGVYPAGGRLRVDLPNDHRQYASFWFGMAFVLLVVWFLSHWQPVAKLEEKHAGV